MCSQLHIVTVATEIKYYMPYLIESCRRNGIELEILGLNQKWEGFMYKITTIIEYLRQINPTDIVCFVDGYDVICSKNLNELKREFIELKKQHNCKIVVSSENGLLINLNYFYFERCETKSINSGLYIGFAKDLLELFEKIHKLYLKNTINDDQVLMIQQCNVNPEDFYIDVNNNLFLSLSYPLLDINNYIDIQNKTIIYNNNKPFFIHANGYGILDNVIINLGYNYKSDVKNKYYNDFFENKILLYFKLIFFNNLLLIVCLLVLIICGYIYLPKLKIIINTNII
jgi:hypothetical protein